MAKKLGSGSVVLMRGHGDTVVGNSIKLTVFHAVYTEANARLQTEALRLSRNIVYLNEAEAAKVAEVNGRQVDRPWELWKSQALSNAQQK